MHDFHTAFPIPFHTKDKFYLFSGDEGKFLIEEYIRKAVYNNPRDNIKDVSPYSDDSPVEPVAEVQILFLNDWFAGIYEEEYKKAKKK